MQETPILDLKQYPPAPRSTWWRFLIYIAFGTVIGFAPQSFRDSLPGINLLLWFPAVYLGVAIHELGHLAAGKMTGMAPGGLVIGGFVMMKTGNRWTVRFDRRRILGGGMAIPLPGKTGFSVSGFAWMVAAGPIASVLSTVVCWIAFLKYGSGAWDWIGSCFWGAAIGLLSLIPMSSGLNKSDAARLWMLFTQPAEAHAWMAAVAVQAESAKGVLPRHWDPALVEQMLSVAQPGSGRIFPDLMAYYRSLGEGNEPEACGHLEDALAASGNSGKVVRQLLFCEAAEVNALIRRNAASARVWRERAVKLRKPESIACVDGSIAMCEGRFDDGIREIAAARAFIAKKKLDSGLIRFAKERLDQREFVCKESLALSSGRATTSASA